MLIFLALIIGKLGDEISESSIHLMTGNIGPVSIMNGRWLAIGDSDFDSYQADDHVYRINRNASNAYCVLSPVEVQARDGRDYGEYDNWGGHRRQDFRNNFSLSGASIRNNIFGWREIFAEDAKSGIKEMLRELRDKLLGRETRLGDEIISELVSLYKDMTTRTVSVVV